MKFSHDNSHSLVSDFTNLILYQETVQAEFNLGMTTLAKSWFSVVSLEAAQSTGFSNTVQNTALRALWFRLFSECRSPLLKTTFESTARPLGMFRPRDSWKLQNGHWLYLDPSFPLTAHSLIVPSQLAVLAQGTLSGRDCHIPSGREWTQLFTASQQNGLNQSRRFLCHTFRPAIQRRRVEPANKDEMSASLLSPSHHPVKQLLWPGEVKFKDKKFQAAKPLEPCVLCTSHTCLPSCSPGLRDVQIFWNWLLSWNRRGAGVYLMCEYYCVIGSIASDLWGEVKLLSNKSRSFLSCMNVLI